MSKAAKKRPLKAQRVLGPIFFENKIDLDRIGHIFGLCFAAAYQQVQGKGEERLTRVGFFCLNKTEEVDREIFIEDLPKEVTHFWKSAKDAETPTPESNEINEKLLQTLGLGISGVKQIGFVRCSFEKEPCLLILGVDREYKTSDIEPFFTTTNLSAIRRAAESLYPDATCYDFHVQIANVHGIRTGGSRTALMDATGAIIANSRFKPFFMRLMSDEKDFICSTYYDIKNSLRILTSRGRS